MANDSNGAGKSMAKPLGSGISNHDGMVNDITNENGTNDMGIPHSQSPGIGNGAKQNSMNALPSNARVIKSAPSTLMTGSSQNRGSGGNK